MHGQRKAAERWRKVNNWSFKGPLLVLALLLGFFDHALHWGRAPFAAGVAMLIPILGFRDLWKEARFWITIVLLGVLHVPLAQQIIKTVAADGSSKTVQTATDAAGRLVHYDPKN